MKRLYLTGLATLTALLGILLLGATGASAATNAPLPVVDSFPVGLAHASPTASPPGANNFACRPSSTHPDPVVLVPGTFEDMADNFNALSPLLANHGYCVFALNYGSYDGSGLIGVGGIGDIPSAAGELSSFVNRVLAATGASKVDIVGHSQGGMMPRYYLKNLGGAAKVDDLIGLAPSNYGTTVDGAFTLTNALGLTPSLALACPSCVQQDQGSAFLDQLNAGGDTVAGVNYTVIETADDEVVTPYTNAFLRGPGVTDELLQNQCSLDHSDHLAITYDHIALDDVLTALGTTEHPACTPTLPLIGG